MLETRNILRRSVGMRSALALVVANMIGAGIFTTTGFQAEALGDPLEIYGLWILGGLLAFCGALSYSELGAAMPRAGGEYVYLREAYGGAFAFMSALVSLTAGFSAPIASALESLVRYMSYFFPVLAEDRRLVGGLGLNDTLAIALVWLLVAIHAWRREAGIAFNDWITVCKVAGILALLMAAAAFGDGSLANLTAVSDRLAPESLAAQTSAFATSLIFVMFCYSGWNSAAYLAGELREPERVLPRALLFGTALVTALYLGLNVFYFYGASVDELAGVVEVGLVASRGLFGPVGVTATTLILVVSLLASASAMTLAGPRVYWAAAQDHPPLRALASTRQGGAPARALVLQGLVTSGIVLAGRVDQIMQYAGFTLSLFGSLAVSCVIVLRIRRPEMPRPFRALGYPWTPALFLGVSAWMMFWAFVGRPVESSLGLATVAIGGIVYFSTLRRSAHGD